MYVRSEDPGHLPVIPRILVEKPTSDSDIGMVLDLGYPTLHLLTSGATPVATLPRMPYLHPLFTSQQSVYGILYNRSQFPNLPFQTNLGQKNSLDPSIRTKSRNFWVDLPISGQKPNCWHQNFRSPQQCSVGHPHPQPAAPVKSIEGSFFFIWDTTSRGFILVDAR